MAECTNATITSVLVVAKNVVWYYEFGGYNLTITVDGLKQSVSKRR
jgi:hypothetical protein